MLPSHGLFFRPGLHSQTVSSGTVEGEAEAVELGAAEPDAVGQSAGLAICTEPEFDAAVVDVDVPHAATVKAVASASSKLSRRIGAWSPLCRGLSNDTAVTAGAVRQLIRPRDERADEGPIPGCAEAFVRRFIGPAYERADEGPIPGRAEAFVR